MRCMSEGVLSLDGTCTWTWCLLVLTVIFVYMYFTWDTPAFFHCICVFSCRHVQLFGQGHYGWGVNVIMHMTPLHICADHGHLLNYGFLQLHLLSHNLHFCFALLNTSHHYTISMHCKATHPQRITKQAEKKEHQFITHSPASQPYHGYHLNRSLHVRAHSQSQLQNSKQPCTVHLHRHLTIQ